MPHDPQGLPMGGSGWRVDVHPSFTFAPLLAIALNRQALLVPLHSDHTRPLGKLWHRDALSQDHVDLPSFHVQLLPLPDVDILQCQSRHDIHTSCQTGGGRARQARSKAGGGVLFLPCGICSLVQLLPPPVLSHTTWMSFESTHYPPVNHFSIPLVTHGNHSSSL